MSDNNTTQTMNTASDNSSNHKNDVEVEAKRVELTELFFDLVYVYAIAQLTTFLHHPDQYGGWYQAVADFCLATIVLASVWMTQTALTNRYGKGSLLDNVFLFIDMGFVLYLSNAVHDIPQRGYGPMFAGGMLATAMLAAQYVVVYCTSTELVDKVLSRTYITLLLSRVGFLACGVLWGNTFWGTAIAICGMVVTWLFPSFMGKIMACKPANFPHLLERLTLLTIVTFGEMIVAIAQYFKLDEFSITSVGVLFIVASLFVVYTYRFNRYIDEHRHGETGLRLMYLHYVIFAGLSLVTAGLTAISEHEIAQMFSVSILYAGLLLFDCGLILVRPYIRSVGSFPMRDEMVHIAVMVAGGLLCLVTHAHYDMIVWITCVVLFVPAAWPYFWYYVLRKIRGQ